MTVLWPAVGYQLVAIVYAVFSGMVASRGSRSRVSFFFLGATAATAVCAQLFVFTAYDLLPDDLLFNLAGVLRDSAWLVFSLTLMYPQMGQRNYWRAAAVAAAMLTVLQLFLYSTSLTFGNLAGVSIDITLVRVITTILSFVLIENVLRNAPRADFWALKHWAIGLSAMLVFQLIVRIPEFLTHTYNSSLVLADPLVTLIVLPLFVICSARLPQLQLRIHSSRTFVFHTATLIAVGVLLQGTAFAAWYVRSYGGTNGTALALTVAFGGIVGVVAALVSGAVRSRIRLMINKNFFNLKYDYRVEWERAIRGLTASPEKSAAERALRVLCNLLDTSGGAIWLYQESWRQFKLSGKLGASVSMPSLSEGDDRIELLREDDRPFVEFSGEENDKPLLAFKSFVDDGWVVLPLRYRSTLVGFVVLNRPRVSRTLDWEDESLVRILAMQATAHLVQEETAQSLADARQLEDFNKRFAFVVHDIKNTIGQLSLLVRNIAQFGDQKEFRDDMVITLSNSVERLEAMLKGLTVVGTNNPAPGARFHVVDLNELFADFVAKKTDLGYLIALQMPTTPSPVNTDSVALSRVLEHVVSNAFEASEPGAPVEIDLSVAGALFKIVVTDRGAGMTQQFIDEELFRPLRSTKRGGFGVGGYQIRELMRDLGGDVSVESVVGSGTRVILSLPRTPALVKS
ncbi:MAG: PEP-CTERM system histidine kinase PrsK [Alphaproteobacteria bacterium]|nr:PEP-CTERM system histidine kinase PrsK [Alphaproteobacteria bacterium]